MARAYKAHCLVLKKTKLGESDLILTMLDESGVQVRGVAKGARKPGNKRFGARLEPFSEVSLLLYPGKTLESITEVECLCSHDDCRGDLDRAGACNVICEFLDKVTRDGEAGERVFKLTGAAFDAIGKNESTAANRLCSAFLLKAVSMIGFRPALNECALCGAPAADSDTFKVEAGGVLCTNCGANVASAYPPAFVAWLKAFMGSTLAEIASMEAAPDDDLLDFCQVWISEHVGIRLKTLSFLRTLM